MGSPRTSSLNFGEASQKFVDAGIPAKALLPIAPPDAAVSDNWDIKDKDLGKAPGRWNARAGNWRGLHGALIAQGVGGAEQTEFMSWPTANVGVLGRYVPGIDSDAVNENGRRLVEDALTETFGRDAAIAERLRGKGPRRLYAFEALAGDDPERWVRTRHVAYRLKGEGEDDPAHKLDVIGYGAQYLISGTHPSGDAYEWHPDFDLADLYPQDIHRIENADVERFLETLQRMVEERGGKWLRSSGGSAPGLERDYSASDPIMDPDDIMRGLKSIPNTEDNFPEREDAVLILSSVRAALGAEADQYVDDVAGWFTADGWADDDYFDKIWKSLDTGQRVAQDSLDRIFRKHGLNISAKADFPTNHDDEMREHRLKKKVQRDEASDLLDEVAGKFVFSKVNSRTGSEKFQMRRVFDVSVEWPVVSWWKLESLDLDVDLLDRLQGIDRYSDKGGVSVFLRDVARFHPRSFYTGETRNPNYDRGDLVPEEHQDGTVSYSVNMRFMSQTLVYAKRPPKNPKLATADVKTVVEFMSRVFGEELLRYELDTLAYMMQTGKRPGHLLFLVGDQGVGKSIYLNMLVSMFDGIGKDQGGHIDGSKLLSDGARRFALASVEGCRIISIKELPDGATVSQMQAITSALKQIVDAGPDADWFQIERKGQDARSVQNHARVVISSNYRTAIPLEEQDRRTFYVMCGITEDNKPEGSYYADLAEVTTNPQRLAAFARFLQERDISHYVPTKAPPVTKDKLAAIILAEPNPIERHMLAALESLRFGGRWIFDGAELCAVMSSMADNEYRNAGIDDRREYDFSAQGGGMIAAKRMRRYVETLGKFKTSNGVGRLPTVYAFRNAKQKWEKLAGDRNAILNAMDDNRADFPRLPSEHPIEVFRGSAKTVRD